MLRKKVTKSIEEFFRFLISAFIGDLVKKEQVYIAFKEFWEEWLKSDSEESLLNRIVNYGRYWNILFKDEKPPESLKNSIFTLRTIDSNMPTPLLLSVYNLYESGIISINELNTSISLINTYIIRRHMNGLDTSSISMMFPALFRYVEKKCQETTYSNFVEILKYYLVNFHKNNAMFMPNDEQTLAYLLSTNAYTLRHTKTFFSILESEALDTGLFTSIKDNPITIDSKVLTVEHIMPQEPTQYWRNCVDEQDKYEYYANLLGNLTLADKRNNSRMSNRDFEYKKNALKSIGRINMNIDIISKETWDSNAIIQRTIELSKKFVETFPYFESTLNFSSNEDLPKEYYISLDRGDINVKAILHADKTVDILAGSTMRKNVYRDPALQQKLLQEIEKEKIFDRGDIFFVEEDICGISSISTATNFVYGGSSNGWLFWTDENGVVLNDSVRKILEENHNDLGLI